MLTSALILLAGGVAFLYWIENRGFLGGEGAALSILAYSSWLLQSYPFAVVGVLLLSVWVAMGYRYILSTSSDIGPFWAYGARQGVVE